MGNVVTDIRCLLENFLCFAVKARFVARDVALAHEARLHLPPASIASCQKQLRVMKGIAFPHAFAVLLQLVAEHCA